MSEDYRVGRAFRSDRGWSGLVKDAGVVLLRKTADVVGLTRRIGEVFGPGWVERMLAHHAGTFGSFGSGSTLWRTLDSIYERALQRLSRAPSDSSSSHSRGRGGGGGGPRAVTYADPDRAVRPLHDGPPARSVEGGTPRAGGDGSS